MGACVSPSLLPCALTAVGASDVVLAVYVLLGRSLARLELQHHSQPSMVVISCGRGHELILHVLATYHQVYVCEGMRMRACVYARVCRRVGGRERSLHLLSLCLFVQRVSMSV